MIDFDLLRDAYRYAWEYSEDPNTKNGAVFVAANGNSNRLGANRFPDGVDVREDRLSNRIIKLMYIEHAERDAIYRAVSYGIPTVGGTLYSPWSACPDCAKAIIGVGIKTVVRHKQCCERTPERWKQPIEIADQMFKEAGVEVIEYDGKIGDCESIINGERWEP